MDNCYHSFSYIQTILNFIQGVYDLRKSRVSNLKNSSNNWNFITAQPIRNLWMPASPEMNKTGFLQQASLTLSPQSPSLFLSFPPNPLPLSTPATQANYWLVFLLFLCSCEHDHHIYIQSHLNVKIYFWLAQLGEHLSAEQEVTGSNPGQTNTQGLK